MSVKRYAAKRDANERDIINALKDAGCLVLQAEAPDLIVQTKHGDIYLLEIKAPTGSLTSRQKLLIKQGWDIQIVYDIPGALEVIG